LALQLPHQLFEALALFPDQVRGGNVAVLEHKLGGVRGMHAELLERPRDLESGRSFFDHEQVVARVPSLALALGDDQGPAATRAVGDEGLAPVDDELVAESS